MKRRTFLQMAGVGSLSIAAGCSPDSDNKLFSLVKAPSDMVTGAATWYASTCRECPAGCGVLAKNREGRVIKLEGNPLHPINRGTLCMRGQAAVQALYHPDRLQKPMLREGKRWQPISLAQAEEMIRTRTQNAAAKGPKRVRMLSEVTGASTTALCRRALEQWQSEGPLFYEAFAFEALKTANREVFGIEGLPIYRIDQADVLLAMGADFLESWLSPVEYARKFKAMHALEQGRKGLFWHVSPVQTLTAANADSWLVCRPGREAVVVYGLIHLALTAGRGTGLDPEVRRAAANLSSAFSPAKVAESCGIDVERLQQLADSLLQAQAPLVLGAGASTAQAYQVDVAVNILNLVLDPGVERIDFSRRHRVEMAASRQQVQDLFSALQNEEVEVLLLNGVNPVYSLPEGSGTEVLKSPTLFTVSFSNFFDETSQMANLVIPTRMPLEAWDEYAGRNGLVALQQPASGRLTEAEHLTDILLRTAFKDQPPAADARQWLFKWLADEAGISDELKRVQSFQQGGQFDRQDQASATEIAALIPASAGAAADTSKAKAAQALTLLPLASIRFFDGRSANRPWLCEVPDPLTKVAWQSPVLLHPQTAGEHGLRDGEIIQITSKWGAIQAPVYTTKNIARATLALSYGQGHEAYGRYAAGKGANPVKLFNSATEAHSRAPLTVTTVEIAKTGKRLQLANTDGSKFQYGRKIAMRTPLAKALRHDLDAKPGLTMHDFPLTLPTPEGYDRHRDIYPSHEHSDYRWGMVVDLDRCIGCSACAVACYAENNIGIVGEEQIINGREMSWMRIERYLDETDQSQVTFLPLMCQQCDQAPCESVCPVYAPHHSKEGLNNQIYPRCIGTRFCSQNCPYKVRRFNWYTWQWPKPLNLQLNPDVTVRMKGVMEKCSFCIQRIKTARNQAKNENRLIKDGEVIPACVQTCPTGALTFGNYKDMQSRLRELVKDPRAYQVMGYLNIKPAVIYLKKVVHSI